MTNRPQYAFGHGLSYTSFVYTDLKLTDTIVARNKSFTVSLTVKNSGPVAGEEVVQLYLRDRVASVTRPMKELKGFEKVMLQPGESKTVRFIIDNSLLKFYSEEKDQWIVEPGEVDVMIGSSSDDIRLQQKVLIR